MISYKSLYVLNNIYIIILRTSEVTGLVPVLTWDTGSIYS
jgi:hypothetical protein